MKYLFIQLFISILTVILLKYLLGLDYFVPVNEEGYINGYNVGITLILLFLFSQSILSLVIYLVQKFIGYSLKEFPNPKLSFIWSISISLILVVSIIFNIYGILDFVYSFILISISIFIVYMILFYYGND